MIGICSEKVNTGVCRHPSAPGFLSLTNPGRLGLTVSLPL